MAAWDQSDVEIVAPELVTVPAIAPATFVFFIAMAERMISADVFGESYEDAGALLTAHLMIRSGYGRNSAGAAGAGAATGTISSMTVDRVSVSFANGVTAASAGEFATTRPGSLFWALVELHVIAATLAEDCLPGVL